MGNIIKNLTGQRFGRLVVIQEAPPFINKHGTKITQWYCNCDCGNKNIIVRGRYLTKGSKKSCGCLKKEKDKEYKGKPCERKYNTYKFYKNYCIGYSEKGDPYIVDLEDYEKIKDYYWYYDRDGYVLTRTKNKNGLRMHRFLMDCPEKMIVDHINHITFDNRKQNLRICTRQQNSLNKKYYYKDKTTPMGVVWNKTYKKWVVHICYKNHTYCLGSYDDVDIAINIRKMAEKRIFGEYSNNEDINNLDKDEIINILKQEVMNGA